MCYDRVWHSEPSTMTAPEAAMGHSQGGAVWGEPGAGTGAVCVFPRAESFQIYVQFLFHAMLWFGACWGGQRDQRTSDGHE